ncbi:hypothetical protein AKO1_000076 [Acrasis kona]|uniref:Matrin-type domain-containing protein n=1 Tax=Acrasis kona TaxID=1008807 RepID=A0AAW2ZEU3_9EUKA
MGKVQPSKTLNVDSQVYVPKSSTSSSSSSTSSSPFNKQRDEMKTTPSPSLPSSSSSSSPSIQHEMTVTPPPSHVKYYCEICDVYLNGPEPYQFHLSGRKHQQVEKRRALLNMKAPSLTRTAPVIPVESNSFKAISPPLVLHHQNPLPLPSLQPIQQSLQQGGASTYYCQICNIQCTGPESYKAHLDGKAHNKLVKRSQVIEQIAQHQNSSSSSSSVGNNSVAVTAPDKFTTTPMLNPPQAVGQYHMFDSNSAFTQRNQIGYSDNWNPLSLTTTGRSSPPLSSWNPIDHNQSLYYYDRGGLTIRPEKAQDILQYYVRNVLKMDDNPRVIYHEERFNLKFMASVNLPGLILAKGEADNAFDAKSNAAYNYLMQLDFKMLQNNIPAKLLY